MLKVSKWIHKQIAQVHCKFRVLANHGRTGRLHRLQITISAADDKKDML